MRTVILRVLLCVGLVLSGLAGCAADPETDAASGTEIYLVRHAEKRADASDPALTVAGEARAQALAERLSEQGVKRIYSTDYVRTQATAAPLAEALGLDVISYDPSDLPAFAAHLVAQPGTSLVVGHSNTTPELVEALGGQGGPPIVEATEYDRLYRVRIDAKGTVETELMRYGVRTP